MNFSNYNTVYNKKEQTTHLNQNRIKINTAYKFVFLNVFLDLTKN
jgi:hypothetical protein